MSKPTSNQAYQQGKADAWAWIDKGRRGPFATCPYTDFEAAQSWQDGVRNTLAANRIKLIELTGGQGCNATGQQDAAHHGP